MTLEEIRLTRRSFLKSVAALAAGAMVPGLNLTIEKAAYTAPIFVESVPHQQRFTYRPHWQFTEVGDVLAMSVQMSATARNEAEAMLLWTCDEDVTMGWWADWLELHENRNGQQLVDEQVALPETVGTLKTKNGGVLNRDSLGVFPVKPGGLLMMGLCSPNVNSPHVYTANSVRMSFAEVYGIELRYEDVL